MFKNFSTDSKLDAIAEKCREANGERTPYAQLLCLAEEVGEFIKESRIELGLSRKKSQIAKDLARQNMNEELADVVITALVAARIFNIDIENEINRKLERISDRGGY